MSIGITHGIKGLGSGENKELLCLDILLVKKHMHVLERLYTISPKPRIILFLQLPLHHVRGPSDLRTVSGDLCGSL